MEHPTSPHSGQKATVPGAIFGRFVSLSGGSVPNNFGMNGKDAMVVVPSKALT